MEEWIELSDDDCGAVVVADDGDCRKNLRLAFDLDFQIEKHQFDSRKERLRRLFDEVLLAFLREKSAGKCIRPIPAVSCDGRPVDLFKLFWLVRKIGGHETVSRHNLWGVVSEECGSGYEVTASIKLIYMKYLNELDQWLQEMFSKRVLEDDYSGFVQKLDLLSQDLGIRCRGLLPNEQKREENERDIKFVEYSKDIDKSINVVETTVNRVNGFSNGQIDVENEKSWNEDGGDIVASAVKIIDKVIDEILNCKETVTSFVANDDDDRFSVQEKNEACNSGKRVVNQIGNDSCKSAKRVFNRTENDACKSAKRVLKKVTSKTFDQSEKVTDNEKIYGGSESLDNLIPSGTDVGNVLVSRKRKRQFRSFSGMLSWLMHVAKHSNDPSVGSIPECSKWSDNDNEEFWAQILLVREALLMKRNANKIAGEVLTKGVDQDQQKKPRMHPSMYEDDVLNHRSTEKLRFSKRIPLTKSHLCPCCNSSTAPQSKDVIHREAHVASPKAPSKLVVADVEELPSKKNDHESSGVHAEKKVYVGRLFQIEVPEWTGVPSKSDPKWLGTRMSAPEDVEENSMMKVDPIGKGRYDQCNCPFPGSVECVRFHIAEKRLKLKQELGSLFYRWRFNRMGEEVSLSWTEEEERTFKDNMRSYSSLSNKFWNNACRFLPSKTREELVSYYYNVYLVQRRSYQNRATPKDIDSDDDDKGCGSIGGSFGYKALSIPGSGSISCSLNQQSTEFV